MSGSYNYSKSFAVINTLLDHTNTNSVNGSLRINVTPEDRFSWFLNGSLNKSYTTYEINESQNQKLQTVTFGSELNYKFIWNLFLIRLLLTITIRILIMILIPISQY